MLALEAHPVVTLPLSRLRRVSRDMSFNQATNVALYHKEVDKNSKWRGTIETSVFQILKTNPSLKKLKFSRSEADFSTCARKSA